VGQAWGVIKRHAVVSVAVAFIAGLLVGGVLGWWGLGGRSVDWGTAGEWVPGILSGAATAGALWWAISAFHAERRDRERAHAGSAVVTLDRGRSRPVGDDLHLYIRVGNYGALPIANVVISAEVGEHVERGWRDTLEPRERRTFRLELANTRPAYGAGPTLDGSPLITARVWMTFEDANERWWRKEDGRVVEPLSEPPPEGLALFQPSKYAKDADLPMGPPIT
jgi:hypothetical protein